MDSNADKSRFVVRLLLQAGVSLVFLLGLLLRLWVVQVLQGEQHRQSIASQSVRRLRVAPVRGRIFAADGQSVLVDNRPDYQLAFHVVEMHQPGRRRATVDYIMSQVELLARQIERPLPFSREFLERHLRVYPALPIIVFTDLNRVELARVSEMFPRPPGLETRIVIQRSYPYPGLATHLLGFVGRRQLPDPYELSKYSYARPELQGRTGLEKQYDSDLAGQGGMALVRVDTLGFVRDQIGQPQVAKAGHNLILSLDLRAQQAAENALRGVRGALVAVDVTSGAVLAMASMPTYNLADLGGGGYGELAQDTENRPLVNRALAAGYLPGSIVKPLIGLAALEAGVVSAGEEIDCPGYYLLGKKLRIRCAHRYGHGHPLAMVQALEQSCNTYFIDIGQRTGLDRLLPVLSAAGLGVRPGLDLPYADHGLLPTRQWAREYWKRNWIASDTAFLSIGQGAINLSPLQAAMYTAAIANGGTLYEPYLAQEIRDPQGGVRWRRAPIPVHRLPVTAEHLAVVRQGMADVVNGENATAPQARNPAISLAGKTGTAEVGPRDKRTKNTWFTCYGPLESPRYAVTVLVENGASGGKTAAPIASQFLQNWLTASQAE
jgi:penicillin-binding protein 2